MTFTINETSVYVFAIIGLVVAQIYQQTVITRLQKEVKRLWEQAATSAVVLFAKVDELDKKVNDK